MAELLIATIADLKAIDSLRRGEQEAVGFLPMSRYEIEITRGRNTVMVLRENGDHVGFLYWTRGWPVATIQQIVIRGDARRIERGTALVDAACAEMAAQRRYGVTLRCRADLPAIEFWKALGFRAVRYENSGRRGPAVRFYREIQPALLDLGEYLRPFAVRGGMRQGFRTTKA